jgi:heat shock protein HslJ
MALFTAPGSILVAILAAAPGQTGTAEPLAGTAWRAVELAGQAVPAQPSPQREPHLAFGTDGRVSGADGCNRLTGPYAVTGEAVTFGNLAGTMMACPGTDEIARRFRAALKGTSHWRIEDGRLKFYGATGQPLAVFERREAAPAAAASPLEGTTWQLVTFRGGGARRSHEVHDRVRGRRTPRRAHRLQPRPRHVDVRRRGADARSTRDDPCEVPGGLAARPDREAVGEHPLVHDQGRPPVPLADGRRRHLRARAGRAASAEAVDAPRRMMTAPRRR